MSQRPKFPAMSWEGKFCSYCGMLTVEYKRVSDGFDIFDGKPIFKLYFKCPSFEWRKFWQHDIDILRFWYEDELIPRPAVTPKGQKP